MKFIPGWLGRMVPLLPRPCGRGRNGPSSCRPWVASVPAWRFSPVARPTPRSIRCIGPRSECCRQNGCDIFIPPGQGCCGAIHFRQGDGLGARRLADANLLAFELDRYDAIVVNHAGCGSMLKNYGLHWKDGLQPHREKFAAKVKDVHELLDELGFLPPGGRINATVAYHDACRLGHAQGITAAPRRLLSKIPGLDLRQLPESDICCGSAGTYNLYEAEMADRLGCRKIQNILGTGASIVLAADAGCLLQIAREIRRYDHPLKVMHTMELLDWSYQ